MGDHYDQREDLHSLRKSGFEECAHAGIPGLDCDCPEGTPKAAGASMVWTEPALTKSPLDEAPGKRPSLGYQVMQLQTRAKRLERQRDALRTALQDLVQTPKTMTRQQAYRNAARALEGADE